MMSPLTASWNDISVQFVSITKSLNLIFQKVIEVTVPVVNNFKEYASAVSSLRKRKLRKAHVLDRFR